MADPESPGVPLDPTSAEARAWPRESVKLIASFGLDGSRRNNVMYIAPGILIHSCGDIVHFLDLKTMTYMFQHSVEGNGIGCVAVHPKRTHFCVCEKGVSPNIYIYAYPSMELYKTLVDGTERYFSGASFNFDGTQLATVGAHPDYLLTVWDWENELMILRSKAFSQEVFKVDFSRYFKGQLLTSGVGHARFWKMASTFTGLKLEGAIAKFGTVPISDIAAYFELRNSKVVTGTEMGTVLVWDDALVKCQLKRPGGDEVYCHQGMIEYLVLDEDARFMITAAADGYIRFWDLDWLEAANDGDDKLVCEIVPTKEVLVDPLCRIKGIVVEKDHWIIQDEGGALWRSDLPSFKMTRLLEFHAGPIVGLVSSPISHEMASAGSDGTVGVTGLACSGDGQVLASTSLDGSVFFFHCPNSFRPLGYTTVPGSITCLDWSPNSQILLVGCSNGMIKKISRPDTNNDTTKSFELKDLTITDLSFIRPKIPKKIPPRPRTPPSPPPPASKGDGEEAKGETRAESEALKDGVSTAEVESLGDPAVPLEIPLEPLPRIPTHPPEPIELDDPSGTTYPIRSIFYSNGNLNSFYVSTEGMATGFLFECHSEAGEVMGWTHWSKKPIKTIRMTHSRKYFVSGSDNGVVRIQMAPLPGQLMGNDDDSKYWEAGLHDAFYGVVTGAALSFDDQYLASVSEDGSFFIHTIHFIDEKPAAPEPFPPTIPDGDVEDVPGYMLSIEEWRRKAEQDEIDRLAKEAKMKLITQLEVIRNQVAVLLEENGAKERNQQLALEDFVIDFRLFKRLEEDTIAELEQARKELQWDSEKRNVGLRKLRSFFLDPIEVEHIVIHAFASVSQTSTFRVLKLTDEFKIALNEARRQGWMGKRSSVSDAQRKQTIRQDALKKKKKRDEESADEPGITKLEYRRRLLKQRIREWDDFLKTKPDLTWVADEDVEALDRAVNSKGDFKLKTNPGYVVPDDQYTNEKLKRNEIVLFQEAVHGVKMNFNNQFFVLRQKKKELRVVLLLKQNRVMEINKLLDSKDPLVPVPDFKREEQPEVREIVKQEDRDAHEAKIAAATAAALAAEGKSKEGGGLGVMTAGPKKTAEDPKPDPVVGTQRLDPKSQTKPKGKLRRKAEPPKIILSPLEESEKEANHIRLRHEKSKLESEMRKIITEFDDELERLRQEKYRLEVNMKCADLKALVMYEELKILRKLQTHEDALDMRCQAKLAEDADIVVKLAEHDLVVDAAQEEVQELTEQRDKLFAMWMQTNPPPDLNPAHGELHRMYIKKMRRPKKPKENPDDETEESDLDEVADDDEEEYEDEDFVELCPGNGDPALYKRMVAMRDRRCFLDYAIIDQGKIVDALLKEKGQIIKKKKAVASQLNGIESEIVKFQTLKQTSLNNVEVGLTLKMNQVEYMENGRLPEDLSRALVFALKEEQGLIDRLRAHGERKKSLKKLHKELKKMHADLQRERRAQEKKTKQTEAKYVESQMLKFGETLVDETLNIIMIKKDLQFLRDKLRNQEVGLIRELSVWHRRIERATDQLRSLTKENAAILHIVADLKEQMQSIHFDMTCRAATTYTDSLLEKQKAESDQNILSIKITKQDEMIQELKKSITRTKTVLPKVYPCDREQAR
ncbi:cilia- and flagella-associated protein 44 isoform X4 [Physcomitrium patens]|uniref:cilia- and flagella-associated protein 44 isoform X4 n=1 Tax=Physcomitrium patens TaxID=3218 RepID=UPI000D15AEA0|nr:cilia- and flagella-associated protein 44-like isoform X3 [Physcomitrium patens]|eukprot:XP_024374191.1 cilia- and flagella-associated protein 44-like isoform X3 [Physcomitrella patens]